MNLIMRNVEFPENVDGRWYHSYVSNVFWFQKVGKVSEVSLIPYVKHDVIAYVCLVKIKEWFDSECAYNFVKRLNDPSREVRLIYSDDDWWSVELNDNLMSSPEVYTVKFEEYESVFDDIELNADIEMSDVPILIPMVSPSEMDIVSTPTLVRSDGDYQCRLCQEGQGGMYTTCKNDNCEWYKKSLLDISIKGYNMIEDIIDDIVDNVVDVDVDVDIDEDDCPPPSLERGGNYWCALCGQGKGGMQSTCDNVNCEWYNKSFLEIAFGDKAKSSKKAVSYADEPPTIIPVEMWNEVDAPPTIIPPESWLNCGIELDDIQDEWVKISTETDVNVSDDVPPNILPPKSWLTSIPDFPDTNSICGFCGESKRSVFSICWNSSCERHGKSIDDIYEEKFNLDLKNVTLRNHQRAF
jgi:hypothetical protein